MKRIILLITIILVSFQTQILKAESNDNEPVIGLNIGNKAPEISDINIDGKQINLSDFKGKIVLIDFWASWCGPCRRENPNIVNVYQLFKEEKFKNGKGFEILSISLDQNKSQWESAISADKLEWPYHISDLKGWYSKWAGVYKVNSIPGNFLLDGNGIIIAKNLRGPQLQFFLSELKKK